MRVVILAGPVDNQDAGVHVYTVQMIKALLAADKQNEYILFREKRDEQFGKVKQVIVPSIALPIGFASLRMFFIVPFLCWWHKANVVIEPAHFGPFNLPASIKRITIIHDLTPLLFPQMHRWHSRVLQQTFLRGILKRTDLIVANSYNTERDLHRVFSFTKSKTTVCYPGVEDVFTRTLDESVLKQYGLDTPYFLSVGTIEPRKNFSLLTEAFDLFLLKNPECNYRLVIAGGKGWKYESFFATLKALKHRDRIVLTGYVPKEHLPVLYSSAKGFFYLSSYEGFGFPVVEAMACGALVVTPKNSSLTEAGGEGSVYIHDLSKEDVAEKMQEIYLRKITAQQKEEVALKHLKQFSWKKFGEELTTCINLLSR